MYTKNDIKVGLEITYFKGNNSYGDSVIINVEHGSYSTKYRCGHIGSASVSHLVNCLNKGSRSVITRNPMVSDILAALN